MTGYTVHTGASKKFVSGWDNIFGNASAETTKKKAAAKAKGKSTAGKSKKSSKKK